MEARSVSQAETLLEVRGLRTSYFTREGEIQAVRDVDLEIRRGEIVGLVGESGAGKSTVAWSIMNLVPPPGKVVSGSVLYQGKDLLKMGEEELREIRGRDVALIVPNARGQLNPVISVGKQLANAVVAHARPSGGMRTAVKRAVAMMKLVGIPDPQRRAGALPGELSGGMAQRIVIGMGLLHSPTLLIADEPTSGLDVTIQAQVLETFRQLISDRHAAALIVTRDLGIVAHYCDRAAVMYGGEIVEEAPVKKLFAQPAHPYTQGLLTSLRYYTSERFRMENTSISFNPMTPPRGCYFYERCTQRKEHHSLTHPQLRRLDSETKVRCFLYDER